MANQYETPGSMARPEDCPYRSPMEEFIQSPDAPSYRDIFDRWGGSIKYMKVTAAESNWYARRREYWDAQAVSDIPEGQVRLRPEDRDSLDSLTYDLDNGIITLDDFRSKALPAILRGLISLSGSGAADVAHKALWNIAQLVAARPSEDTEVISRYERTKPEEIEQAIAQIMSGEMPDI